MEEALVVALALWFGSAAAATAVTLPAVLVAQITELGIPRLAVIRAARIVMAEPLTGRRRHGSPTSTLGPGGWPSMARTMAANEPAMRARYLLAAAKRLGRRGQPGGITRALRRERTYFSAHRRAGQRRAQVGREYDKVAARSVYLRWSGGSCGVCASRNGSTWHRDHPPAIVPGAAHPWCRCITVPA